MATYTQSAANPAYFDMPTFEAPMEFLFSVARQKQQSFDKGLQNVRQSYNHMLNLPTNSPFANARKEAFMAEASEKLRRVAGADFSLEENQTVANSIYKPLTSDPWILKDISNGKVAQAEISYMNSLQHSSKPEERQMYWDSGREYVMNSVAKLYNAKTADELDKVSIRKYVPYVDVAGKLNKAATDLKLKVEVDTTHPSGYKITDTNGNPIPFYVFAQGQLGAQEREVFKVLGTNAADRRIAEETYRFGGDEQAARKYLATQAITDRFNDYNSQKADIDLNITDAEKKIQALKDKQGGQINDLNIDEIVNLETKKSLLENQRDEVLERLRNIGYNQVGDSFVKNNNYDSKLNEYSMDLWIPYMEEATKSTLFNWASGLAGATMSHKLDIDPVFKEALDLKKKELELTYQISKETSTKGTKDGSKEGEGEDKTGESAYYDTPILLGDNPFGQDARSAYDYYKSQKKAVNNELFRQGTTVIYDSLKDLGLSSEFLSQFSQNMLNGASTESIISNNKSFNLETNFKEDVQKIHNLFPPKANISYSEVFSKLMTMAKDNIKKKLDEYAGEEGSRVPAEYQNYVNVSKLLETSLIFNEKDRQINEKIFSSGKFEDIRDKNDVISLKDFERKVTGGRTKEETIEAIKDTLKNSPGLIGSLFGFDGAGSIAGTLQSGKNLSQKELDTAFKAIETVYNRQRKAFDEEFKKMIQQDPEFLQIKTASGEIAFTFPVYELMFHKNTDKTGQEKAETFLKQAFADDKITDETKILNMDQLGKFKNIQPILQQMMAEIGDMDPDKGRLFYSQVGSDGTNPSLRFRPSKQFLQPFLTKNGINDSALVEAVTNYGVEVSAAGIPGIEQYKPSIVSRLIDAQKGKPYQVAPLLAEQGFGAVVEKRPNNEGFDIKVSYKYFDQNGKEVIVKDVFPSKNFVPIASSRLDEAISGLNRTLFEYLGQYRRQAEALKPKPTQTYTDADVKERVKIGIKQR